MKTRTRCTLESVLRWLPAVLLLTGCGLILDLDPDDPDRPDFDAGVRDAGETDAGPGGCLDGASREVACGVCASETEICQQGLWVGQGCTSGGICMPGDQVQTVEGCEPGFSRLAQCDDVCELTGGTCEPLTDRPFVVVPDGVPPSPSPLRLRFDTHLALVDIYFLIDQSGSVLDEAGALRGGLYDLLADRTCFRSDTVCVSDDECRADQMCSRVVERCVESPASTGCVPSLWSGLGGYVDSGQHLRDLSPDHLATVMAFDGLGLLGGSEQLYTAARELAEPVSGFFTGCSGPGSEAIGCPSYRSRARRLLFVLTDEAQSPGGPSAMQSGAALQRQGITLVAVHEGDAAEGALDNLAFASNSIAADGTPLVFQTSGSGQVIRDSGVAIDAALTLVEQDIAVVVQDLDDDGVDATQFIDRLEIFGGSGCFARMTRDTTGDGLDDTIDDVPVGQRVCYDLYARPHPDVMSGPAPQVFRAEIFAFGDGALVDRRVVAFIVP